jgi:hypothetical protein
MLLLDKIEPKFFFLALAVGLFMTYTFTTPPKIVYKYPTPDTVNELVYQDNGSHCFKYKANEVNCPANRKDIHTIPSQDKI